MGYGQKNKEISSALSARDGLWVQRFKQPRPLVSPRGWSERDVDSVNLNNIATVSDFVKRMRPCDIRSRIFAPPCGKPSLPRSAACAGSIRQDSARPSFVEAARRPAERRICHRSRYRNNHRSQYFAIWRVRGVMAGPGRSGPKSSSQASAPVRRGRRRGRKASHDPWIASPLVLKPVGRNDDRGSTQLQFARTRQPLA